MQIAKPELLTEILQNYLNCVPSVKAASVFDRSGSILSSKMKNVGSIQDSLLSIIHEVISIALSTYKQQFSREQFGSGLFQLNDLRIVFSEAGPNVFLLAMYDLDSTQTDIFMYNFLVAEKVTHIVENDIYEGFTTEIPDFQMDSDIDAPSIKKMETNDVSLTQEGNAISVKFLPFKTSQNLYKFIILGDPSVGKTSLVEKYTSGKYREDYLPTLGISITQQKYSIKGIDAQIKLLIWDLAGQENFKYARKMYIEGAHFGFLVFDVTSRKTFEKIPSWYQEVVSILKIPLIIVANKIDIKEKRVVTEAEGRELAKKLGCSYIETSAKTGENVKDAFQVLGLERFFSNI
jgi:Ras-related protein Rab-2A